MKVYFISHKVKNGVTAGRIFDEYFNEMDKKGIFLYSLINNRVVGSILNRVRLGSCRYDLLNHWEFESESEANNFVASKKRGLKNVRISRS